MPSETRPSSKAQSPAERRAHRHCNVGFEATRGTPKPQLPRGTLHTSARPERSSPPARPSQPLPAPSSASSTRTAPPAAPRGNWVRRPKRPRGRGRQRAKGGGLLPRRGAVASRRLRVTSQRRSSRSRSRPRRPSALSGPRPPSAAAMANVADTKLYDILGVPPGASDNELKKVRRRGGSRRPGTAGGSAAGRGWIGRRTGPRGAAGEGRREASGPGAGLGMGRLRGGGHGWRRRGRAGSHREA